VSRNEQNQDSDDFITTSSRVEGYEVLIYDFRHSFSSLPGQIEFNIEYNNRDLPFEIEKSSGKVYYLISEDTSQFNSNGEKHFFLNISLTLRLKRFFLIEIKIINDDQLIQLRGLTQKFKLNSEGSNKQVGRVTIYHLDSIGNKRLNFELAESENYEIDAKTGYLFAKNETSHGYVNIKLTVAVSGYVGAKCTLMKIDVFLYNDLDRGLLDKDVFDFKLEILSDFNDLETEFVLSRKYEVVSEARRPARFGLLNNELERHCQLNMYNGVLSCYFQRSVLMSLPRKVFNLAVIAYYLDDKYLQYAKYAQVSFNFI
jgi:hypothetical protein